MSKRLTDTSKWDDDWYLNLSPTMKCAWDYICEKCDGCGFIKLSFSKISFEIKGQIGIEDFKREFGSRVVWLKEDKIWIPGTLLIHQKGLSSKSAVHQNIANKVIRELKDANVDNSNLSLKAKEILSTLNNLIEESRLRGDCGPQPERSGDGCIIDRRKKIEERRIIKKELEEIYKNHYPRKKGKTKGLEKLERQIQTQEDLENLRLALANFILHHKRVGTKPDFVPYFSTWVGEWEDWLDPEHGKSEDFSTAIHNFNPWEVEADTVLEALRKFSSYESQAARDSLGEDRWQIITKAGGLSKFRQMPNNEFTRKRLASDLKNAYDALMAGESGHPDGPGAA